MIFNPGRESLLLHCHQQRAPHDCFHHRLDVGRSKPHNGEKFEEKKKIKIFFNIESVRLYNIVKHFHVKLIKTCTRV